MDKVGKAMKAFPRRNLQQGFLNHIEKQMHLLLRNQEALE
jgi:hypothetical protein